MDEKLIFIINVFANEPISNKPLHEICKQIDVNECDNTDNSCGSCLLGRSNGYRHASAHKELDQWRDSCESIITRNTVSVL